MTVITDGRRPTCTPGSVPAPGPPRSPPLGGPVVGGGDLGVAGGMCEDLPGWLGPGRRGALVGRHRAAGCGRYYCILLVQTQGEIRGFIKYHLLLLHKCLIVVHSQPICTGFQKRCRIRAVLVNKCVNQCAHFLLCIKHGLSMFCCFCFQT